ATTRLTPAPYPGTGGPETKSSALPGGGGGNIEIQANSLPAPGAGPPLGPTDSIVSGIASQSRGSGPAGDVNIVAGSLQVLDGAKISTQTAGPGRGGNVNIQAGSVLVSGINGPLEAHLRSLPGSDTDGARSGILASSERLLLGDAATGRAGRGRVPSGDGRARSRRVAFPHPHPPRS